ncbi:MAG: right-handed parallel beta-helix repeat-containing protein [candidate division Zixibacteria bacterium]|nr:right-handed parallel beta-helix repeat-containing protein [candidate division Zixibacteria bacterium]
MSQQPAAFMSYVRFVDEHETGRLSELRNRLSGEIRLQTGEEFHIFQDRADIAWGQQWKQRIDESLDAVTFLIPIITPGFFKSPPCCEELNRFLEREKKLKRQDLILPVYYVNCPILNDEAKRQADPLARVIAARQYIDWRELRFEPFTSPQVGKMIARMAAQIVEALERGQPKPRPMHSAGARGHRKAIKSSAEKSPQREEAGTESADDSRGPLSKTEPPTLIVDAFHRGDHLTLGDALKAAKPGDRILVRPGLYKEGVTIDKPVEIIGDGALGEVVIEAKGKDTVVFMANMGRVANLTLRQVGGGDWYCIDITQGRLDLEGCDITSQSRSCVKIHGGADPRLCRNQIHESKRGGVYILEYGQGSLEDNDIYGNMMSGVVIKTGGNPILRRNRIHDSREDGILVGQYGQGVIEDNDIFGNAFAGVEIREGGNPTLRRNRIYKNLYEAIWVYKGGQGVFEDNDLRGNANGAWDIAADCLDKVKLARNKE